MTTLDETHDRARSSWLDSANGHQDFPIHNLPLGVFDRGEGARIGVAIGNQILDLTAAAALLDPAWQRALSQPLLNDWFAHRSADHRALRRRLSALLSDPAHRAATEPHLVAQSAATMQLPARIGDYTDFYVGIHHATNVGRQFRPDQPLMPNYKYVPIGYHGRASSVRVSGEPVIRPGGQRKPPEAAEPIYSPSRRLDYELELGIWIGHGNPLGQPIPIADAADHIAGYTLLNDWSARDLQAWEYQPLGPFLAKNFLTTVSPWIVTADALLPFRAPMPPRPQGDPVPLPYLGDSADQATGALGIHLEVTLSTEAMRAVGLAPHTLSKGESAAAMYWSAAQIVAHHSSNGCNLSPGDLIGTGTLSTEDATGLGSLLEISNGGKSPLTLPSGEQRSFLEDGDELTLTGWCEAPGAARIGFGTCTGRIIPAR